MPSSTSASLTVPSLQSGDIGDSTDFPTFLEKIIEAHLKDGVPHEVTGKEQDMWLTLISALCQNFLTSFPGPSHKATRWKNLSEKATIIQLCLTAIKRAVHQFTGILKDDDCRTIAVISDCLSFLLSIDAWVGIKIAEGIIGPSPLELRNDLLETIEAITANIDDNAEGFLGTIRMLVSSLFRKTKEIDVSSPPEFPTTIEFYDMSNITTIPESRKEIKVATEFENFSHFSIAMCDLIYFQMQCLSSRRINRWFSANLCRDVTLLHREIAFALLSASTALSEPSRCSGITSILKACTLSDASDHARQLILSSTASGILLWRLREAPQTQRSELDRQLRVLFDSRTSALRVIPKSSIKVVVELFLQGEWTGDRGELKNAVLLSLTPHCEEVDCASMSTIKEMLGTGVHEECEHTFLQAHARIQLRKRGLIAGQTLGKRKRETSKCATVVELLKDLGLGDGVDWPEASDKRSENSWTKDFLAALPRNLTFNTNESCQRSLSLLKKIPCALLDEGSCGGNRYLEEPNFFNIASLCLKKYKKSRCTSSSIHFYDVLLPWLRHAGELRAGDLDILADYVNEGLAHSTRSVRLAAGQCIVEVLKNPFEPTVSTDWIERIFELFKTRLDYGDDQVKESTIATIGAVGKSSSFSDAPFAAKFLGHSLFLLFSELNNNNVLLRGLSFSQLHLIAKSHKKTPYLLFSPYMARIATFVMTRAIEEPNILIETCRFLVVSPVDFLSMTSTQTLPVLYSLRNIEALDFISRKLEKSKNNLFLSAASDILTHIFLLNSSEETNLSLGFLMDTLGESARGSQVGLQNIIRSYIIPLLGKLLVASGADGEEEAYNALQAIQKVEENLEPKTESKTDKKNAETVPSQAQKLTSFLEAHMLGIITYLSDIIQDVQGRKSNDMKQDVLRGLGQLIVHVGSSINIIGPQIMAILHSSVRLSSLVSEALRTWNIFITTLKPKDLGPHVGATSAALIHVWESLNEADQKTALHILDYLLNDSLDALGDYVNEVVDLSTIPDSDLIFSRFKKSRNAVPTEGRLRMLLDRVCSDNTTVVFEALKELKFVMLERGKRSLSELVKGDSFHPLVGEVFKALLIIACRPEENASHLRDLAFVCLGILGAVDPDRIDLSFDDTTMIVLNNFNDETESIEFVLHLVENVLVGVFRSTNDMKYQSHLAYALQELLKFCGFRRELLVPGASVPNKVRARWNGLPKNVIETISPLVGSKFKLSNYTVKDDLQHPIYHHQPSFGEWVQNWVVHLITCIKDPMANTIFDSFKLVVRIRDAGIAHQLLPHLVLNVLISGEDKEAERISEEITTVLKDQIDGFSLSPPDKRLSSAQTIFSLMDHVNRWVRIVRQELSGKRPSGKRSRHHPLLHDVEMKVTRVDSILGSIDQILLAEAAFECKAFARSMMNFEKLIITTNENGEVQQDTQNYFERLHEIYSCLDEPDGMEGISAFIPFPSIEHQIRQHESTGKWTAAQSCWEVRLQQSPDELSFHLGLLRCLRNLGHYDSLRTHIQGVLVRNPEWADELLGFRIESALNNDDWRLVGNIVESLSKDSWESCIARLLLSIQRFDLENYRKRGYRRAYDSILKLHVIHDIDSIWRCYQQLHSHSESDKKIVVSDLLQYFSSRMEATLPTFRTREFLLNMHRATYSLSRSAVSLFKRAIGTSWLESAKIARKAGHWQTAYSAVLKAQENQASFSFVQSAKLAKVDGDPLRALFDLDNVLRDMNKRKLKNSAVDFASDTNEKLERERLEVKANLLRARWKQESERYDLNTLAKELTELSKRYSEFESARFYTGHFHDDLYKTLSLTDRRLRGPMLNLTTVREYAMAIRLGSKYTYQTIPRLLTLWLDMADDQYSRKTHEFHLVNLEIQRAVKETPVYKWLTAFPQILSRVDNDNDEAYRVLSLLIRVVLLEYPQQGLWLFMSVVKSTKSKREKRGREILDQLKSYSSGVASEVRILVAQANKMATELLELCDYPIKDELVNANEGTIRPLSMSKNFPSLNALAPSQLIIPLQDSMTVSLPSSSSSETSHQPFPLKPPTIEKFGDEIVVMKSLARPRKITILGSDGVTYVFLGKPKDDLRKDARLMDFNSIINKLLRANSESRRRQLRIRTYSVVTLNEECGFIQWVPNTTPIRSILTKYYQARGIDCWSREMPSIFVKLKSINSIPECISLFKDSVLKRFPPIFHEWFLDTFPEPSTWLSSRLGYGRTAAVMSMVGFILGLGDRHLENILLDVTTGDAVHVDFCCLFEKGKLLDTPERVPFRLTQNLVDALGVTGVEGVFRTASEITFQLLRDNKDVLMSVLDAFIHDPLVEWEDEKRKLDRKDRGNSSRGGTDLRKLAQTALVPIEKKLKGIYTTKGFVKDEQKEKEFSTVNLVQILIEEATDLGNLSKMYPGWAPYL